MINSMDKEKYIINMEILIKVIGSIINLMELVFIFQKTEINIKVNFKMDKNMDKEK